jgi:hypothetical protein
VLHRRSRRPVGLIADPHHEDCGPLLRVIRGHNRRTRQDRLPGFRRVPETKKYQMTVPGRLSTCCFDSKEWLRGIVPIELHLVLRPNDAINVVIAVVDATALGKVNRLPSRFPRNNPGDEW